MRQIIKNERTINIPDSWYDVSFTKFLELKSLEKESDKYKDETEYNIKHFCLMLGLTQDEYLECDFSSKELGDILVTIYSFAQKELPILKDIIVTIKDKKYSFDKDTDLMSIGRFIDKENVLKSTEDFWDVAHKISASFLREIEPGILNKIKKEPKIKKYNFKEATVNAEIFKNELPMPYIYSIVVFFLTGVTNYVHIMKSYFQEAKNQK